MELSLLADDPGAAETVATWYFNEWCADTGRYNKRSEERRVGKGCRSRRSPEH